ncbi:Oidioi.mRNA.OKI2018_I69.PAR.g8558.t1.cds [Oikopleura dioica]|uniref:Oidioi.mRNA.OKI2018_I69.PAR.g8558.t1.cds n=1 Tax=Oikopleura dioica TaxID=34765 RepID=A0ABN7RGJ0_OIKDI|nr:Oidioi.mRNA.OKI2018_I69.PAR.g8558.t1.cds [Oikopleura dioica]
MEEVLETLLGTNLTRVENVTIEDDLILSTNASTSLNSSVEELHASDLIILRQRDLKIVFSILGALVGFVSLTALILKVRAHAGDCLTKPESGFECPPSYPSSPPPYAIALQLFNSMRRSRRRGQARDSRSAEETAADPGTPPPSYRDVTQSPPPYSPKELPL